MKIKNKVTGEIVEITDPKQLAKYGLSIPKAQTGKIIKGKKAKNNYYDNNYEGMFNNKNPNTIDLYQPPQSYIQGMNSIRPQEESLPQTNISTNQDRYENNKPLNLVSNNKNSIYFKNFVRFMSEVKDIKDSPSKGKI
jgi:hypothetical protein